MLIGVGTPQGTTAVTTTRSVAAMPLVAPIAPGNRFFNSADSQVTKLILTDRLSLPTTKAGGFQLPDPCGGDTLFQALALQLQHPGS